MYNPQSSERPFYIVIFNLLLQHAAMPFIITVALFMSYKTVISEFYLHIATSYLPKHISTSTSTCRSCVSSVHNMLESGWTLLYNLETNLYSKITDIKRIKITVNYYGSDA